MSQQNDNLFLFHMNDEIVTHAYILFNYFVKAAIW